MKTLSFNFNFVLEINKKKSTEKQTSIILLRLVFIIQLHIFRTRFVEQIVHEVLNFYSQFSSRSWFNLVANITILSTVYICRLGTEFKQYS